jgi:hypothetical protein
MIFSGSQVVDKLNTAGFQPDASNYPAYVAIYTAALPDNQS